MRAYRLTAAVLVSALAHALVISRAWIPLPTPPAPRVPLQAQLLERPAPAHVAKPDPAPRPAPPKVARRPPPPPAAFVAPQVADATPLALPAGPITDESATEPTGESAPVEEAAPAPAPYPSHASPVAGPADAGPPNDLPASGQLTYTLYLGTDGYSIGRSTYSWTVERDTYKLISDSETTGIVELFRPQRLTYISQGRLTAGGLRPERFAMTRTRRGETVEARAHLDWGAGRLTYGRPAHPHTVALPAASQDIVSFILQLALNPPAQGRIHLPITNGVRFETYELEVLAEERIETPLGLLVALPLKQVRRDGAESIEVWLAVEHGYLPVKVRFLDREGNPSGEQVVDAIRVGQR